MTDDLQAAGMSEADLDNGLTPLRCCTRCNVVKPLETDFGIHGRSGRRRSQCKQCRGIASRTWRSAQGPQYRRAKTQWELYRLRWVDYEAILDRQGHVCAICRSPFSDNTRLIHTDHKHGCDHPGKGKVCCPDCVRGILCARCNNLAGWIETDYRRLGDLLRYLGLDGALIFSQVMSDVGYQLVRAGAEAGPWPAPSGGRDD